MEFFAQKIFSRNKNCYDMVDNNILLMIIMKFCLWNVMIKLIFNSITMIWCDSDYLTDVVLSQNLLTVSQN